jgi:hypothetical protein
MQSLQMKSRFGMSMRATLAFSDSTLVYAQERAAVCRPFLCTGSRIGLLLNDGYESFRRHLFEDHLAIRGKGFILS